TRVANIEGFGYSKKQPDDRECPVRISSSLSVTDVSKSFDFPRIEWCVIKKSIAVQNGLIPGSGIPDGGDSLTRPGCLDNKSR
uniref:hypothetical protein n=1 Tax=Salmonella enterica TaxID=28901 RepID=UPI00398C251A